jgi:polysaccharide biosynthesis protein PslG
VKRTIFLIVAATITGFYCLGQTRPKSEGWEEFQSKGPELKQIGSLASKHARDVKSSPWSVGAETLDRDFAKFSEYKKYVGELGVKAARLQSGWAKCEKVKGVYNFAWLDSCVYGLAEQGVRPWICLSYGNSLYKSKEDLGAGIFTSDETLDAWCRYVEAIVSRYKNVVTEWEVWNEPRHSESTVAYANLLIRSVASIKKVQPKATIMGFTVHGFEPVASNFKFPREVFEILKANNKQNIVDYVTYHPYTYNPDGCYPAVEQLKILVESYSPRVRLYQGESGAPSEYRESKALSKYNWTELSQAKWVLRRMLGDFVRDIPSSVFTISDLRYTDEMNRKGLLYANADQSIHHRKYAFYAVQHVTSFFDYQVKMAGKLRYASNGNKKITIAEMKKGKSPIVLVWYHGENPDNEVKWEEVDISMEMYKFKDPVYVELISGKVYDIAKTDLNNEGKNTVLKNLPIWDSPVMVAERSQVNLKSKK